MIVQQQGEGMALPDCWDIIVQYLDPKSWLRASLAFRRASAATPAYLQMDDSLYLHADEDVRTPGTDTWSIMLRKPS